jgi:hypothetical protein
LATTGLYYYPFTGQPDTFKVECPPGAQKKNAVLSGITAEAAKKLGEAAAGKQTPLR